jgi:hypothetical protein
MVVECRAYSFPLSGGADVAAAKTKGLSPDALVREALDKIHAEAPPPPERWHQIQNPS